MEWSSEQRRRQMTFSFKCPFPLQMAVTVAASCTFKILIDYRTDWNGKCCGFQLQKTKKWEKISQGYFEFVIAILNLMIKANTSQITLMGDTVNKLLRTGLSLS